eukprot:3377620-Prymnesium_polylepis.1
MTRRCWRRRRPSRPIRLTPRATCARPWRSRASARRWPRTTRSSPAAPPSRAGREGSSRRSRR